MPWKMHSQSENGFAVQFMHKRKEIITRKRSSLQTISLIKSCEFQIGTFIHSYAFATTTTSRTRTFSLYSIWCVNDEWSNHIFPMVNFVGIELLKLVIFLTLNRMKNLLKCKCNTHFMAVSIDDLFAFNWEKTDTHTHKQDKSWVIFRCGLQQFRMT